MYFISLSNFLKYTMFRFLTDFLLYYISYIKYTTAISSQTPNFKSNSNCKLNFTLCLFNLLTLSNPIEFYVSYNRLIITPTAFITCSPPLSSLHHSPPSITSQLTALPLAAVDSIDGFQQSRLQLRRVSFRRHRKFSETIRGRRVGGRGRRGEER